MKNLSVLKPDMAVLGQDRVGLTPFGLLTQLFTREVTDRAGTGTGAYQPIALAFVEQGEEQEQPPAPQINLELELTVVLERLGRQLREEGRPLSGVQQRIVEQVLLREIREHWMSAQQVTLQLPRLRRELEQCRRILAQEGTRQRLLERVEQLRRQQRDAARELAETERKLTALEAFYRYQAGFLESRVNSLFRMASFRLFRDKVEGGLEERCDLVYRGVPWTGLNSAAKVNLGIDVINSLSRFYGFTAPLFIDNAESVTSLEDTDTQVIRLAVRPGEAALRLEGGDHGS